MNLPAVIAQLVWSKTMSISTEIQALYNLTKDKLGELPAEVHAFFAGKVDAAKADEAAAAAEEAKIQAEIAHLTSVGYSVVKVTPATGPVVGAPISVS